MNLTEIRNQKGMTQTELAEACGIGQQMISHMEKEIRKPSYATLVKLAEALDCSVDDLIGDDKEATA